MSTINLDDYENFRCDVPRSSRPQGRRMQKNIADESARDEREDEFRFFIEEGIILRGGRVLKPGKEAIVYRCEGQTPRFPETVAIKAYKRVDQRSFKKLAPYLEGRLAEQGMNRRNVLHLLSSPESILSFWVDSEFQALRTLHGAGLPVPEPYARSETSIAMEYVGDGEDAPRLHDWACEKAEGERIRALLIDAVARMLRLNVIHGDLSPYNVLIRDGEPVIIDFPQAIDARYNREARPMLERDILAIIRHFPGTEAPETEARTLSARIWSECGPRGA